MSDDVVKMDKEILDEKTTAPGEDDATDATCPTGANATNPTTLATDPTTTSLGSTCGSTNLQEQVQAHYHICT